MKKVVVAACALLIFAFGVTSVMARDAADIFKRTCSQCHGLKGEGIRGYTATLKGSEFVIKGSDEEVRATIKNGRIGTGKKFKNYPVIMYPNKDLTDTEIDSLVKYLKNDVQK